MSTALVDPARYARWTGDNTSEAADIIDALADAQSAVDEYCHRAFAYGTYQETLYIYPDGKVYPAATPLDTITQPSSGFEVQGAAVWVGWYDPYPILANPGSQLAGYPPQTTITYSGGYQPFGTTDGPTPPLPVKVARAIAQVAYRGLHPVQAPLGVPANVNSVHVGDVGYSAPKGLAFGEYIDDTIEAVLAGYVRRQVRGWQSAPKPVS